MNHSPIQIGIVGATGYTGVELLRLLADHPLVHIKTICSRSEAGTKLVDYFPQLRSAKQGLYQSLTFADVDVEQLCACDVVFFATPHGVAMSLAHTLLAHDTKVIDLAADFRLHDLDTWSQWYGMIHTAADLMPQVAYGLCEIHRSDIRQANIIGNPGCYPTAVQLGWYPLLSQGLIEGPLIADGKSGVSGAGRGAKVANLYAEMGESFKAYAMAGHRHKPEIEQGLNQMNGQPTQVTFVPHLLPMTRGMELTLYAQLTTAGQTTDIQKTFEHAYANEPFIDVLPPGQIPETASVRGSNLVRIGWAKDGHTLIVSVVLDNLVKGAAGQAVQNMNLLFDLPETTGLTQLPLMP